MFEKSCVIPSSPWLGQRPSQHFLGGTGLKVIGDLLSGVWETTTVSPGFQQAAFLN
jgi:hypothetical protein